MDTAFIEQQEIKVAPSIDSIDYVVNFVGDFLNTENCPKKEMWKILNAVDELFGNIVRYSKTAESINVCCWKNESRQCFQVRISDNGIPFNPLLVEEPILSSNVSERAIGGLGIFISKKLVDSMIYEYQNNRNILVISKEIREVS